MNNTLKHVSKLIFLLSLSSIMEHAPTKNEWREENVCAITQNFEVMEHEQSAKSWLKKCKFTVRKCLVEFAEKCVLEHQKRTIFNPKMSGTQGWILAYFVVSLIHLTLCI